MAVSLGHSQGAVTQHLRDMALRQARLRQPRPARVLPAHFPPISGLPLGVPPAQARPFTALAPCGYDVAAGPKLLGREALCHRVGPMLKYSPNEKLHKQERSEHH